MPCNSLSKHKKDSKKSNEVFRDKLGVAINKVCLINLIDQLQLTISYKHVLLSEIQSNAKYQRNIYYIILDVHDISVSITKKMKNIVANNLSSDTIKF